MARGYYTVVYRVDGDRAVHDEWWKTVQPLFMAPDDQPIAVTAISIADEITRLNCIENVAAAERAEREREAAVQAERRRQEQEAARVAEEARKREANIAHRRKINREAVADLVAAGLAEDQGVAVVTVLAKGAVRHCSISY